MAVKSIFGTEPNQVPRNSDLGPMAYLRPEDIVAGYLHVRDEKASGTSGGNSTATTYHDRTLNTVVVNTIPGASLSSNQVTLSQGVYEFYARAVHYGSVGGTRLSLYNVTDSTVIITGDTGIGSGVVVAAICEGRFTISGQKVIKLRHYTSNAVTDGLGSPSNVPGVPEVYASLIIRKVA